MAVWSSASKFAAACTARRAAFACSCLPARDAPGVACMCWLRTAPRWPSPPLRAPGRLVFFGLSPVTRLACSCAACTSERLWPRCACCGSTGARRLGAVRASARPLRGAQGRPWPADSGSRTPGVQFTAHSAAASVARAWAECEANVCAGARAACCEMRRDERGKHAHRPRAPLPPPRRAPEQAAGDVGARALQSAFSSHHHHLTTPHDPLTTSRPHDLPRHARLLLLSPVSSLLPLCACLLHAPPPWRLRRCRR
jgi:hypothetical protein